VLKCYLHAEAVRINELPTFVYWNINGIVEKQRGILNGKP
jgi:hypothetical protein